jgi:transposase
MKSDAVYIGVDVSKAKLDVYVPPKKEGLRAVTKELENNIKGLRELRNMAKAANATVCVEPTGGYELELIAFMHKFNVPVAYADALRVRQFAKAEGNLSKNDTIDAALISRFADKIGVRIIEEYEIDAVELKRKTKFRQTLIDSRTVMISKLETEIDKDIRVLINEQIKLLNKLIKKVEVSCIETVNKNQSMKELASRFTEISGVGDITAFSILAGLPEIGTLDDAKLNCLVGIAPVEKQSGAKEWHRKIWGGRKDVRNALYMAAVASIKWNAILGGYYHKKRAEGHPHKWAIVPTMRKLLSLLNKIARDPRFTPGTEPESTKRNANVGRKKKAA